MEHLLQRHTLRGFELRQGIEAFAHRLCTVMKLKPIQVRWCNIATAAMSDNGRMLLADVADDHVVNRTTIVRYAGFVLHELCHRKFTNFNVQHDHPYVSALHNAIEDAWIEHNIIKLGNVANAENLLGELIDIYAREAMANVRDWSDPRQYPFMFACNLRKHGTVDLPIAAGLESVVFEAGVRLNACKNSQDTLAVAEWIYKQLQAIDEPKPSDNGDQAGDQAGDQGDQAGDQGGQAGDQGGQAGDQAGQAGDQADGADGADGAGDGADGQPAEAGHAPSGKAKGGKGKETKPARKPAQRCKPAKVEYEIEPQGEAGGGGAFWGQAQLQRQGHHLGEYSRDIGLFNAPAKLRQEVRNLFDNSDRSGFDLNRRNGALNTNALHRVGTGSDRVFKRRWEIEGIDSAVIILLDVSGSMFPELIGDAVQTCDALADALISAQAQVSVMTFGNNPSVAVPFGATANRIKTTMRKVHEGGGTEDAIALRHAHNLLLQRQEQRKVCFVITDGAGDHTGTMKQCKSGEALGITTIGVGIGHGAQVDRGYTNAITVLNSAMLAKAALQQIKVAA